MANRIQKGYRSHMEQNSPDMDKMWEKIQQHIDSQPQKPVQTVQENQPEPEMKRRRIGFVKYAAAAACLVAVSIFIGQPYNGCYRLCRCHKKAVRQ